MIIVFGAGFHLIPPSLKTEIDMIRCQALGNFYHNRILIKTIYDTQKEENNIMSKWR